MEKIYPEKSTSCFWHWNLGSIRSFHRSLLDTFDCHHHSYCCNFLNGYLGLVVFGFIQPENTCLTFQPLPTFRPVSVAHTKLPSPRPSWRFHNRSPLSMTA